MTRGIIPARQASNQLGGVDTGIRYLLPVCLAAQRDSDDVSEAGL